MPRPWPVVATARVTYPTLNCTGRERACWAGCPGARRRARPPAAPTGTRCWTAPGPPAHASHRCTPSAAPPMCHTQVVACKHMTVTSLPRVALHCLFPVLDSTVSACACEVPPHAVSSTAHVSHTSRCVRAHDRHQLAKGRLALSCFRIGQHRVRLQLQASAACHQYRDPITTHVIESNLLEP